MNNVQNKICFLTGTLGQGGAERQLFYYVSILHEMGNDVMVMSLTQGDYWEERIRLLGIPVIWVGKYHNRLLRLINIIYITKKLSITILQSQHFHTNLYTFITSKLLFIKGIGALRSDVDREVESLGKLGWISLILPDCIVANSKKAIDRAIFLGVNNDRLFYLPNFVDEEYFRPTEKEIFPNRLSITFIGTLWQPKRADRVIKLARMCLDDGLKIKFSIYGDGVLLESLKNLAIEYDIPAETLKFYGRTNNLLDVFNQTDILLLTSDHEGTPNVVLEAMSCGIPIVSSRVGDVPDIVKDGRNGFSFPVTDLTAAFNSLKKLYYSPEMREMMGKENRDYILNNRSIKNIKSYFIDLYSLE